MKRRHYLRKLLSFALKRVPTGSREKREVLARALEEMEEVAHFRLPDFGFSPRGIVDVGAHIGDWSRSIRRVFPLAPILMIEARQSQQLELQQVCDELRNARAAICLLGSERGRTVQFHLQETGSSVYRTRSNVPSMTTTLVTSTLDDVVAGDDRLKEPLFLKLDVQGAEIEVLRGGLHTLSCAELARLEVSLLPYIDEAPSAAEVIRFMDDAGFAIFDIVEFARHGNDLIQIDIMFAKKNSPMRRKYFTYENYDVTPV